MIDDFLTRRYWDNKPYPFGLGTNIELDYNTCSVEDELNALKKLKEEGIEFCVFIVGKVMEMARTNENIRKAWNWLNENNILICGHGFYHTEQEYNDGYMGWANAVKQYLSGQKELVWRYPREQEVNRKYIEGLGFMIPKVDGYLDHELLISKSIDCLRNKYGNWVIHSLYLEKVLNGKL